MFENKLVAIVNKEIDIGVAMNAIAHMAIGLGTTLNKEILRLNDYKDKDNNYIQTYLKCHLLFYAVNQMKLEKLFITQGCSKFY